jgi:heme o synthase
MHNSMEIAKESRVRDYLTLLKPRVMLLVVFTGAIGMYLAPGVIHPLLALITILCIAAGSGGAAAINMWYDRDIDAIMNRTKTRPIPSGYIIANEAFYYGIFICVTSVIIMGLAINFLSASILAFAIFYYTVIYTIILKRRTPQNIVIGGLAGSLQPLIGWTAVTGEINIEPVLLCLLIFMWTPPHFWALSLYKANDYKLANIPMLPVTAGIKKTKTHIFLYSVFLVLISLIPYYIGFLGVVYLLSAISLGSIFIYLAIKVIISKTNKEPIKLFAFSIIYLFLLFSSMILDQIRI